MELLSYERPREKLAHKGAEYLTTVELIQIIIGSGTAQSSGARIARQIARLLAHSRPTHRSLCEVRGVGAARAGQVIAALEFGRRLALNGQSQKCHIDIQAVRQRMATVKHLSLIVYFFDGSNRLIGDILVDITRRHETLAASDVARIAIAKQARQTVLVIGSKQKLSPVILKELDVIKRVKDALTLISVSVIDIIRVDADVVEKWEV